MALQSLASLLRVWATPAMEAAGFRKNRGGYRFQSEDGGLAFVETRQFFGVHSDFVAFKVDTSVAPAILTEFALRDLPEAERRPDNRHWGNWTVRLYPAEQTRAVARALLPANGHDLLEHDPPWIFPKAGDVSVCGQDLHDQLLDAVPGMLQLLDAEHMLAAIPVDPHQPPWVQLLPSDAWTKALLLSTRGDSPELQEQLAHLDARRPDNPVSPWIRARLRRGQ